MSEPISEPVSNPRAAGPGTDAPVIVESMIDEAIASAITGTLEEPEPQAVLETGQSLWAVIFAGGIGTRFWPLSTPKRPKQLLALVNERPLIADTVARLSPLVPAERVLVVTSADIAEALHRAIPEVPTANMLVEPRPLGTAAALAWGAMEVSRRAGPDAVLVAMHADLATGFPDMFRDTLRRASLVASTGKMMVAIGAQPTRTESGFGYLTPGAPLDARESRKDGGACQVEHFVEKPTAALADTLIDGGALWNTGVFVVRAKTVLHEIETHVTELKHALPELAKGNMERFAELVTSVSIDRGLFERSRNLAVMLGEFAWDDVGTWAALRRVRELDDTGNGVMGEAHLIDASGNVIHADNCCVVVYGVSGMLVVSLNGLTFVTTLERATELGPLLNALPGRLRFNPPGME